MFPEGPRWHDGRLWFSEMYAHRVMAVELDGTLEVVLQLDRDRPSGIGFLPDGTPLIVLMDSSRVVRLENGRPVTHADLGEIGHLNDMVVGPDGSAYVGSGWSTGDQHSILLVRANGEVETVAEGIPRPNGIALSPDFGTLVYGATHGRALMALTVGDDGGLSDLRVFADLSDVGAMPDGICFDVEGAVWLGGVEAGFFRVREGGHVEDRISFENRISVACALGGADRRTLFLASTRTTLAELREKQVSGAISELTGFLDVVEVEIPGAGRP